MNEAETRAEHIDPALKAAGWGVVDGSRILRHFLPYNALNLYDRMGILSFILMIFIGGPIVRFLMAPTLGLVRLALNVL